MNYLLHISFAKGENDIPCLLIARQNNDGSLTMLKEFYGEEAEALYNFFNKAGSITNYRKGGETECK